MKTETIRYDIDDAGVVTLTMDDPTQSANTMRGQFVDDYDAVTRHIDATGWGVVTMTAPVSGKICDSESCTSPVPGGMSMIR